MLLFLIIVFCVFLYFYVNKNYDYWYQRNVPHMKPTPIFGNYFKVFVQKQNLTDLATTLYKTFPYAPVVGFYRAFEPLLVICDPDLIKSVLSADFQHFYARGEGRDIAVEPLFENAFHSEGDKWKAIRQRLTPAFTSGKLKGMFPLIVECAEQLKVTLEKKCNTGEPIDVKEILARYTTDFIGACGFGIKMNSLSDENSQLRKLGKDIFQTRTITAVKFLLKELFPKTFNNMKLFDQRVEDSIVNLVQTVISQRNNSSIGRNDFIDLLLDMRNKGKIITDSMEEFNADGSPKKIEREIDINFMAAQAFIFFAAGFETSSSASSYTLHQIAYNPDVQAKVKQEIDTVLAKYDNKLCYDAVKELEYLERCFSEGLRMFPSVGALNRLCSKNFPIPGTDIVIEKGTKLIIPVAALQHDERYYKNPGQFDPDRFLPEVVNQRHKYVYLPFGEGPRACIGTRLGQMQSVAGLAALLQHFSFLPVPGKPRELPLDPASSGVQSVIGGVPLLIKKRHSD